MRETFNQRVFLALCGDEAPSHSSESENGGGTFLPHLSLLGAVQSRQLGEFLDGKGIGRLVSSDKPQAVECALLARQQLMSGGKLVRLSQLQKGMPMGNTLPCIQEEDEILIASPRSKGIVRARTGYLTGIDETVSTRSPLTSPHARDPSILGEDELSAKRTKQSSDLVTEAINSIQKLYSKLTLQNTCGSCFTSCIDAIPGPNTALGTFNEEAMRQVVSAVQREDIAVVCGTLDELNSCLQALEQLGKDQRGEHDDLETAEKSEQNRWAICGYSFLKSTMASCFIPFKQHTISPQLSSLPAPGSVWEVQMKRDAETLQIVEARIKANAKTDYLSRACTHIWESRRPETAGVVRAPLSVTAVRERLESDLACLADSDGFVDLEEAAILGAVYGAAPTRADLRRWEQEKGPKVNLKGMHHFIDTFKNRDCLEDLVAPFARFDREKTGHISRLLFLTLLGLAGEDVATEDQVATLFRLYGLSFGETVNYLEFISRVTDGCDLLDLGSPIGFDNLPSRQEDQTVDQPKSRGGRRPSRGWSCRDSIQSLLSSASLKAYTPSIGSAAAIPPPESELLVKVDPSTGKVEVEEVLKLLATDGKEEALPEDITAFLTEVPASARGIDAALLSALKQFIKFRHTRFSDATNGLGWLHITDAEGLFEDFSFDELPHKLECRQFQRKIGTSQLHYKDFLSFGNFVSRRRAEFRQYAEAEATGQQQVTLRQGIALARLWGFSPSLAQTAAMRRQLEEQRRESHSEGSLVRYEELLELLSAIPHPDDQSDELALLFRHFDLQDTGTLPAKVIRHLVMTFGEPLKEEEVNTFFRMHCIDATDRVAYAELVEAALAN